MVINQQQQLEIELLAQNTGLGGTGEDLNGFPLGPRLLVVVSVGCREILIYEVWHDVGCVLLLGSKVGNLSLFSVFGLLALSYFGFQKFIDQTFFLKERGCMKHGELARDCPGGQVDDRCRESPMSPLFC